MGGEPGRLQLNRNKWGSVLSVCVCLDVPPAFRFTLRREGLYDRLATGLARVEERGARVRAISCSDGRLHIHLATRASVWRRTSPRQAISVSPIQ